MIFSESDFGKLYFPSFFNLTFFVKVTVHSEAVDPGEKWLCIPPHPCKSIIINICSGFLYWTILPMCGPLILVNFTLANSAHRSKDRLKGKRGRDKQRDEEGTRGHITDDKINNFWLYFKFLGPGMLTTDIAYCPVFCPWKLFLSLLYFDNWPMDLLSGCGMSWNNIYNCLSAILIQTRIK